MGRQRRARFEMRPSATEVSHDRDDGYRRGQSQELFQSTTRRQVREL